MSVGIISPSTRRRLDTPAPPFWATTGPAARTIIFVSHENPESIQAKGDYLKAQGLGGVIAFEVTQDYLPERPAGDGQHPLMTAVRERILR